MPAIPLLYMSNRRPAHTKTTSQLVLRNLVSERPDLDHRFGCQLSSVVSCALPAIKHIAGMAAVPLRVDPFKIFGAIVGSIAVNVVHFAAIRGTKKGLGDKAVDPSTTIRGLGSEADVHAQITKSVDAPTGDVGRADALSTYDASHSAEAADFVSRFGSYDGQPPFERAKICLHRVTSGVVRAAVCAARPPRILPEVSHALVC